MVLKYAEDTKLSPDEARQAQAAHEDADWWASHWQALWERYRGQHIAICDRRVVAAGTDAGEVQRVVDEMFPQRSILVVYMPPKIRKKIL